MCKEPALLCTAVCNWPTGPSTSSAAAAAAPPLVGPFAYLPPALALPLFGVGAAPPWATATPGLAVHGLAHMHTPAHASGESRRLLRTPHHLCALH